MMDILHSLMVRLFAGGILCAAAMVLAGGGAKRESVRLCCVCIMMLIVLSPLERADLTLLLEGRDDVALQIESALAGHQGTQMEAIAGRLEAHINALAEEVGIACTPAVQCHLDENGALIIDSIAIQGAGAQFEAAQLAQRIAADLGIAERQIIWMEEPGP